MLYTTQFTGGVPRLGHRTKTVSVGLQSVASSEKADSNDIEPCQIRITTNHQQTGKGLPNLSFSQSARGRSGHESRYDECSVASISFLMNIFQVSLLCSLERIEVKDGRQ